MDTLKLSKFTYIFPTDNRVVLFHSLLLKKAFLSNAEYEELKRCLKEGVSSSNLFNDLHNLGFLNSGSEDEKVYQQAQKVVADWQLRTLFLVTTDNCNFNCKYCFENLGKYSKNQNMDIETAKSAIDSWTEEVKTTGGTKTIFIYGGEPLTNQKTLTFSVEYIDYLKRKDKLSKPININVITNGSLITDNLAKWAKPHDVAFGVSLDGFEHNQNLMRKDKNEKGTFTEVIGGIKTLRDNGLEYSILCTVGPHNIGELEKICQFFIDNLGAKNINFTLPLNQIGKGYPFEQTVPLDLLVEKIVSASKIIRNKGAYEGTYFKHIMPFVEEKLFRGECDGAGSQVVVTPEGKVGPCLAFMGDDRFLEYQRQGKFNFNIKERPLFQRFANGIALAMPECNDCPALGICGGGCMYNRYLKNGKLESKDEYFCEFTKKLLSNFISELSEEYARDIIEF